MTDMLKYEVAPDWKGQAKAIVDYLQRIYAESLSIAKVRPEESAILEKAAKALPEHAAMIAKIIESQRNDIPWDLDSAYQAMTQLMLASFFIGTATGFRPEAQEYWRKLQAGSAQSGNCEKAEVRKLGLREAISRACKNQKVELTGSIGFAESIHPAVCKILNVSLNARGYSARTIQRTISAILEGRRKS
jgi:hypothetical protein